MDEHPKNVSYPCTIPICNPPCTIHGVCRRPQICDCEVGWYVNLLCIMCLKSLYKTQMQCLGKLVNVTYL